MQQRKALKKLINVNEQQEFAIGSYGILFWTITTIIKANNIQVGVNKRKERGRNARTYGMVEIAGH